MKIRNLLIYHCVLFLLSCQAGANINLNNEEISCCKENASTYSRIKILTALANTLNKLAPDYVGLDNKNFHISNSCQLDGVYIYDLSDSTNFESTFKECVSFIDGHIYHFGPKEHQYSYSNIAILYKNEVKIFEALNCPGKGKNIEDVKDFLNTVMPQIREQQDIMYRVNNYRKYSRIYRMSDPQDEFACR